MISPNLAQSKLEYWKQCLNTVNAKMEENGGSLKRQEFWEREYFEAPYLTFASDDYIAERMIDHFHNNVRLTSEGKLSPRSILADESRILIPLFTHLNLEFGLRGGLPADVMEKPIRSWTSTLQMAPPREYDCLTGYRRQWRMSSSSSAKNITCNLCFRKAVCG